jgi:trk system potassium uptake protein TrkH
MAAVSIALVAGVFGLSVFDSAFHVISAMSTTGFSYIPIQNFSESLKLFLVFLMFVGGASFSTAGGIKIYRFVLLMKGAQKSVAESVTEQDSGGIKLFGREYTNRDILQAAIAVLLAIVLIFVSTLIVMHYGFPPMDALFETTAAVSTTGLSAGIVNFSLAIELKWLFIVLMLLGRVEIFAFLVVFAKEKPAVDPKPKSKRSLMQKKSKSKTDTETKTSRQ